MHNLQGVLAKQGARAGRPPSTARIVRGPTVKFIQLLAGMSQLSFILIGRERNDLRDPTSSWAAARS
jgi:hypothetical protein